MLFSTPDMRVAHLLRRFGFGATWSDFERFRAMGEAKTLDFLLSPETGRFADPHRFCLPMREDGGVEIGTWRFGPWFLSRLLCLENPLQARLVVFWHDHFAVSDHKVENGPMMLDYMQNLMAEPFGRFPGILKRMVTRPAFLKYLDVRMLIRGRTNENLARELLELYTLGIGNYTEQDIQETAKALSGWSYLDTFYSEEETDMDRLGNMARGDKVYSAFALMPDHIDDSEKTVLGRKDRFPGLSILDHTAGHPSTARHICTKLWEHFVYVEPEKPIIDALVKVYTRTQGSIADVLREMTKRPEFWSEKAVDCHVKSPFDLMVGLARALRQHEWLRAKMQADAAWNEKPDLEAFNEIAGMFYMMSQMGMHLMYPDDVDGWAWGKGWLSTEAITTRANWRGMALWRKEREDFYVPHVGLQPLLDDMWRERDQSLEEFTDRFLARLDARLSAESAQTLRTFFSQRGMPKIEDTPDGRRAFGWHLTEGLTVVLRAPSYHVQ
ncbi:MAG: DUF1800 domain-containing protein [Fimbriimonadaceae bacterium]|nr:DUF1800 domain-containing protein [Fimbriimonadaceae bacterium]